MEKLNNTRAIVFGGSESDAGSAAVGSVYILDISILLNTVVCVLYTVQLEGIKLLQIHFRKSKKIAKTAKVTGFESYWLYSIIVALDIDLF